MSKIFAYIYDFVSFLFESPIKDEIKNIILFGSVASGEFDDESDIDIFVDVWDKTKVKKIENIIKGQLDKFEDIATRIWYPRGIKNKFSIIVGDMDSPKWENVRYDAISNGITLYGKYEFGEKRKHLVLITFSLNKLKQREKMQVTRALYGYELKKHEKKYSHEGILKKHNGIKISANSIIIPVEKMKEFRKLFSKFRITPQVREIWTR